MAAFSSKPLPSALHHFAHGTPFDIHRDLASPSSSNNASTSSSFRQRAWPAASGGTDDDFGRFAEAGRWSSGALADPSGGASAWSHGSSAGTQDEAGASSRDGDEVQALLGSTSLSQTIDADWEAELFADQATHVAGITLPSDPPASAAPLASRKGKDRERSSAPGDASPVSSDLISSLSSLDLSSRAYLATLLSFPPSEAFGDYLARGTYTDDVYGLPEDVRRLLEKAETGSKEEGREKAVRRLGMVMRHLWGEGGGAKGSAKAQEATKATPVAGSGSAFVEDSSNTLQHVGYNRPREHEAALSHLSSVVHSSPLTSARPYTLASSHLHHPTPTPMTIDDRSPPVETDASSTRDPSVSYQTDFSRELAKEDSAMNEAGGGDGSLPPFSHFMQSKLSEMYGTGGRSVVEGVTSLLGGGYVGEGRSH
jgi:hypothetical protein